MRLGLLIALLASPGGRVTPRQAASNSPAAMPEVKAVHSSAV